MVGQRIKSLLDKKKISVAELSKQLKTTQQNVYNILKKDNIDTKYLIPISEILEIPVNVLLDENAVIDFGKNSMGWVSPKIESETLKSKIAEFQQRIIDLENQLKDKNEILDFVKRENMFAFANVIRLLVENLQGTDKSIAPEKLNDITRSKIFDESFLTMLLDNGLITESDFLFFKSAKK